MAVNSKLQLNHDIIFAKMTIPIEYIHVLLFYLNGCIDKNFHFDIDIDDFVITDKVPISDLLKLFLSHNLILSTDEFKKDNLTYKLLDFTTSLRSKCKSEMLELINIFIFQSIQKKKKNNPFTFRYRVHLITSSFDYNYLIQTNNENLIISPSSLPHLNFSGYLLTKIICKSIHSIVVEAYDIDNFQNDQRIIIKIIHPKIKKLKNHNNLLNLQYPELKFYEFFRKDSNGCEFIVNPFKIEIYPLTVSIFMKSSEYETDLFEFVDKNDFLPNEKIKKIFLQLAKGIDYLHTNGIVHGDIKDENVLINTKTEKVKLIDFGSSVFLKELEENGHVDDSHSGTLFYTPVEILKGKLYTGPEKDIWCLGIVLYILCFKEFPFHSASEILQGIIRLPVVRPKNLVQLIRNMLDPRPELRPNIKNIIKNLQ